MLKKAQPKGIPAKEVFGQLTESDITLLLHFAEGVLNNKVKGQKAVAKAILKALDKLGGGGSAKRYTISTQEFKSLATAEQKIQEWYEGEDLRKGTKVFEITGVTYKPELKLVKEVKNYGK